MTINLPPASIDSDKGGEVFMIQKEKIMAYVKAHRQKVVRYGVLALVLVVALGVFFSGHKSQDTIVLETLASTTEEVVVTDPESSTEVIYVDIGGGVVFPQVVQLPLDSRVEDAIQAAGGLLSNADVTSINRAAKLSDGEKIYIPIEGEEVSESIVSSTSSSTSTSSSSSGKININTATADELQELTGVGSVIANRIVVYRATYGAFSSIEDIKAVDGIGDKTYEKIKDSITV